MFPQLEEDLIHLEGSGKGFNENCSTDCAVGEAEVGLGEVEDVVPEAGLTVVLHFGEVEVGAEATGNELFCVVEEVKGEIKDGTRYWGVVNGDTRLVKMPSSGTMKIQVGKVKLRNMA